MLRPRDLAPLPPHRHAGAGLLTSNLASSLRKQGPITTGVDVLASDRSFCLFQQEMAKRMGPRVRARACTHLLIGGRTYEKRESYQQSLKDRREGASKTEGRLSLCI